MDIARSYAAPRPAGLDNRDLPPGVTGSPRCALMRDMSQEPDAARRLEWPGTRDPDDMPEVVDPAGNWLPDDETAGRQLPSFDSVIFRESRWAPQHGAHGRSDSALPGAFLFPEPHTTAGEESPEAVEAVSEQPRRGHTAAFVREVVETLLLAILVFLAIRASVQHYRVEGHSMDPTLADGEFLLVNSLVYSEVNLQKLADYVPFWDPGGPADRHVFHAPERGDIVVLHPRQHSERDLVKRIIGLPGETIEIVDGTVYINGRELVEPYIIGPWMGNYPRTVLQPDYYFVMGDNRNASADSRAFGPVDEDDIVGKAMASWWPRDRWGPAPNEAGKLAPAK